MSCHIKAYCRSVLSQKHNFLAALEEVTVTLTHQHKSGSGPGPGSGSGPGSGLEGGVFASSKAADAVLCVPCPSTGATIGQHLRHSLDHFRAVWEVRMSVGSHV